MNKKHASLVLAAIILLASSCSRKIKSRNSGLEMQDFVKEISDDAHKTRPDFIIIPQNGEELLYNQLDLDKGPDESYLNAIDGQGCEELFYDGNFAPDEYRLRLLSPLKNKIRIMVSDYLRDDGEYDQAMRLCHDSGFIALPRHSDNYDYSKIPDTVYFKNDQAIQSLSDAQNYLYLIGADFADKESMIRAIENSYFDLVIIDLFFQDKAFSPADLERMRKKPSGAPRLLIAYMSIGSAENYRYYWKSGWKLHHPKWLQKRYDGYEDEFWVDFTHPEWQAIIYGNDSSYLHRIIDAGFDGVYLDNVEAYYTLYY